ncbi:hypothetical protein HDV05_004061 [Chytridiales sp. JEL 0842]|nr:hypothetical protein HDV05_004061 [Chytridiales sp. JEL 0842]
MKSWQPLLTPKVVLPALFAAGAVFFPLGIALYLVQDKVIEYQFDYTQCSSAPQWSFKYPITDAQYDDPTKTCTITFDIAQDIPGPVFLYYRLTQFYQNHRKYTKSIDFAQLGDKYGPHSLETGVPKEPTSNCYPFQKPQQLEEGTYPWISNISQIPADAIIYPCGAIANSYFSDIISDFYTPATIKSSSADASVKFSERGIAWSTDGLRYKKSSLAQLPDVNQKVFPPPMWVKSNPWGLDLSKGYTKDNFVDVTTSERFWSWMRTAGLPTLRKLWGQRDGDILKGTYVMNITQNFDHRLFGGTKSIVISTSSILGGRNPFLGAAYIILGLLYWIAGALFLLRHMVKPRKLGDYTYLSWDKSNQKKKDGEDQGGSNGSGSGGK